MIGHHLTKIQGSKVLSLTRGLTTRFWYLFHSEDHSRLNFRHFCSTEKVLSPNQIFVTFPKQIFG